MERRKEVARTALSTLLAGNAPQAAKDGIAMLRMLVANLVKQPNVPRYRRITTRFASGCIIPDVIMSMSISGLIKVGDFAFVSHIWLRIHGHDKRPRNSFDCSSPTNQCTTTNGESHNFISIFPPISNLDTITPSRTCHDLLIFCLFSNDNFKKRLLPLEGHRAMMEAIGFKAKGSLWEWTWHEERQVALGSDYPLLFRVCTSTLYQILE